MIHKLFSILIGTSLILAACSLPKATTKPEMPRKDETLDDVQGTMVYNSKTGQYEKVKPNGPTKVDTVLWKPTATKANAPIGSTKQNTSKPNTGTNSKGGNATSATNGSVFKPNSNISVPKNSKLKPSYKVALMLPFFTDKFSELDRQMYDKSYWALNFYSGAKMAIDTLQKEGISLNVNVLDTKANEQTVATLLGMNSLADVDLIIGGETKANVKQIADFAKLGDKIYVSPYSSNIENIGQNANFIQITPNLKNYCEAIVRNIREHHSNVRICCVTRADKANEKEAATYLQGLTAEIPFSEVSAETFSPSAQLVSGMTTVFVIPATKDETYIYGLLRKIEAARQAKSPMFVFGMPSWLNFQVNGFDNFESLKVRIPTTSYIDKDLTRQKSFARSFFATYNTAPTEEAFQGYDLMLYMGRMMHQYGTKFSEIIELAPYSGLSTQYLFTRDTDPLDLSKTNRFYNKYVNILKFENGYFMLEN